MKVPLLVSIALMLVIDTASAQDLPSLEPGAERPTTVCANAWDGIGRFELSNGRESEVDKYVLVGGALGLAAGLAIAAKCQDRDEYSGEGRMALLGIPVSSCLAGMLIGRMMSDARQSQRWRDISSETSVGLRVPADGPLQVALRTSF